MTYDRICPLIITALYALSGGLKLYSGNWRMALVWFSYALATGALVLLDG